MFHHHLHHLSLNREGRWGTTDDFTTSFLHFFSLFSTALWDLANSRPVHFLMLSPRLFLCLPCLPPPLSLCLARWLWPDLACLKTVKAGFSWPVAAFWAWSVLCCTPQFYSNCCPLLPRLAVFVDGRRREGCTTLRQP